MYILLGIVHLRAHLKPENQSDLQLSVLSVVAVCAETLYFRNTDMPETTMYDGNN